MKDEIQFQQLLRKAEEFHGHLCSGQILGVRMAMYGLDLMGITDPYGADRKKLIVFVEVARCAADAIMIVTGCRVGKRSFKFIDTGKAASTFYHMQTKKAVRVALRPDVQAKIVKLAPDITQKSAEKRIYRELGYEELFTVQNVSICLPDEDTPGVPATTTPCCRCGEYIYDKRELLVNGDIICKTCANSLNYYNLENS